jgi:hypothetical protein
VWRYGGVLAERGKRGSVEVEKEWSKDAALQNAGGDSSGLGKIRGDNNRLGYV